MHMKFTRTGVILSLVFAILSSACATAGTGASSQSDPNQITEAELNSMQARSAYEAIEQLRPLWLQGRGVRSVRLATGVLVYQNRSRLGGLEALRDIPLDAITSIRYLDSAAAGQLPGAGSQHVEGAIVVYTRGYQSSTR